MSAPGARIDPNNRSSERTGQHTARFSWGRQTSARPGQASRLCAVRGRGEGLQVRQRARRSKARQPQPAASPPPPRPPAPRRGTWPAAPHQPVSLRRRLESARARARKRAQQHARKRGAEAYPVRAEACSAGSGRRRGPPPQRVVRTGVVPWTGSGEAEDNIRSLWCAGRGHPSDPLAVQTGEGATVDVPAASRAPGSMSRMLMLMRLWRSQAGTQARQRAHGDAGRQASVLPPPQTPRPVWPCAAAEAASSSAVAPSCAAAREGASSRGVKTRGTPWRARRAWPARTTRSPERSRRGVTAVVSHPLVVAAFWSRSRAGQPKEMDTTGAFSSPPASASSTWPLSMQPVAYRFTSATSPRSWWPTREVQTRFASSVNGAPTARMSACGT